MKPQRHQSDLSKFEFCPYAFYQEEFDGKRGLGSFFSCRGNGCHAARKCNLRQKIKTREDLPLSEMQDAARDEIIRLINEERVDLKGPELLGKNKKSAAGHIIDSTVKLVRADRDRLQRLIQPVQVEVTQTIILHDWPFNLGMTMDSVDEDGYIDDLKTSKQVWTLQKAEEAYQPKVYKRGYRAHHRRDPKGFKYQWLAISPKRHSIRAGEIIVDPSDKEIIAVLNRFEAMDKCIRAGAFPPTHQTNWKCSP